MLSCLYLSGAAFKLDSFCNTLSFDPVSYMITGSGLFLFSPSVLFFPSLIVLAMSSSMLMFAWYT